MPSIGQTWVLASIGAVVEMGILSTLKRLLMESTAAYGLNFIPGVGTPRHEVDFNLPGRVNPGRKLQLWQWQILVIKCICSIQVVETLNT
jgi:hypothetical protein